METIELYNFKSIYRDDMKVRGYIFGNGDKSAVIVGPSRGNENEQLYICSSLVRILADLESAGAITNDKQIMVVPSVNHYAFNLDMDFFGVENLDINRCFPGNDYGEPISRLAGGVFEAVSEYTYMIQFSSFFERSDCVPHVRMMANGYENVSLANLFGLPYVVVRKPQPIDTATLNYNLQRENGNAFSVFTRQKELIDEKDAKQAISAVLRFLTRMGIIRYECHSGYISHVINEENLTEVYAGHAGIFRGLVKCGDDVRYGSDMAEILDPYDGSVREVIKASTDGIVFFAHNAALINQYEPAFSMIHRLHE